MSNKGPLDGGNQSLIPARMLNEFVYCPRLFFLELVEGEFIESVDTLEGHLVHRNVDLEPKSSQSPPQISDSLHKFRSLMLSSQRLGLIAKMDLVEESAGNIVPVDFKKGHAPDAPRTSWEADQVQVCAQALILRDCGYTCKEGEIYYAASNKRVRVAIGANLVSKTLSLLEQARKVTLLKKPPPPLVDSPKCPRCSLVGICLPDEIGLLSKFPPSPPVKDVEIRRLYPARDDTMSVYVQEQGAVLSKKGNNLQVSKDGQVLSSVHLIETSAVYVFGNVQITTQVVDDLLKRGIPLCYFTYGGWFIGMAVGLNHKNIDLRKAQFRVADNRIKSLAISKHFVTGKIKNSRTMLRRNHTSPSRIALDGLKKSIDACSEASSMSELLGIEGEASRIYFSQFDGMLKQKDVTGFRFKDRNRRPPTDPVNAILSFTYALLATQTSVILRAVGFDPLCGFYHQSRYGKPSLALDMMEEFRPIIADSVTLEVINNREVSEGDFIKRGGAVALLPSGRRKVIAAFERRLESLVVHPLFGYKVSYRRVLEVQARLLGRCITREIREYPEFCTR